VYAYEYGVANKDFSGLRSLLDKTPDSTALISKYSLNPTQINQIEFGTGFDLDQSGGYGAGRKGNEWDYGKYVDKLKAGDAASLSGAFDALATQDPLMANRARNLYEELLAQQKVTGNQWATGNLGSKDAAAMDFALRLAENNIKSIYDLGQRNVDTVSDWEGTPIVTQNVEYYNKKTGEALPDWGRVAQGTQSGTKLDYQLNFADDGTPIPYTTNAQSEWMEFREGVLKPAISLVALANPALAPYIAAGNALNAASKGDWGSAIVSGLTAAAGFGGDLGFTKETMAMLNQAKTGAQVLNALDKGNPLAIANALMQTDTGKDLISMDMGGGVTLGDVLNTARVAAAVNEGDFASAASYAGSLLNNPDLKVAGSSLALMDAIKTGDPFKVTAAVANLDRAVKTVTKDSGGGITNRIPDDMTEAGAAAFADARRAGASDEDAMAAANAVTGVQVTPIDAGGENLSTTTNYDQSASTVDTNFGDLAGAQNAAIARNTVAIGNAEADNPDEAAYLAKLRDPTATQFSYGGKTYIVNTPQGDLPADEKSAADARLVNSYVRSLGKTDVNQLTDSERKTYLNNYDKFTANGTGVLKSATIQDVLSGNSTYSAAESYNNSIYSEDNPFRVEITGVGYRDDSSQVKAEASNTDAAFADLTSWANSLEGPEADTIKQLISTTAGLFGEQLADLGTAASQTGLVGRYNALVQFGEKLEKLGSNLEIPGVTAATANFWDKIGEAETFGGKLVAGLRAVKDQPLALVNVGKEIGQEALPILLGGAAFKYGSKTLGILVDASLNGLESMGSTNRQTFNEEIAKGTPPEQAERIAAGNGLIALAITTGTAGLVDTSLVKGYEKAMQKIGGRVTSSAATELPQEAGEEFLIAIATGDDIPTALTKAAGGGLIGGKTSGSIAAASGSANADAQQAAQSEVKAAFAEQGLTSTDGSFRPETIQKITETGTTGSQETATEVASNAGTAGANVVAGGQDAISVSAAQQTAADLGLNVSDDVAVSLATKIEAANNSGNDVSVTSDANIVTINDATANTKTTVDANTGTTTVVDANTNTTTQTKVDANTQTTVTTNANTNTNTQTTVDTNTNVTTNTNVNTNTNVATQTTTNLNTNITTNTTVNPNTNITTQTTTNANTNIETTVVTDTNTNVQTTVQVNTDTGEIITKKETDIPDGWTPPEIDVPVVPTLVTPPTVTPPKAPAPAAPKLTPQLPAGSRTGAGGVLGLPSEINVDPASLRSKVTEGAIDPLARVKQAQAELERDVMMSQMDPRFLNVIQQRSDPQQQSKQFDSDIGALAKMLSGETDAPANQSKYYSYGSEDSIDSILGGKAANYKEGGFVEPLKASGGMVLPLLAKSGGALGHYKGREDFKHGKHVAGDGDGQSDDIPAWLADGEFVFPADVVSALGNGSTKAGTDKLYEMMHGIRDRARSKGPKDLPPPALKSPLNYLKSSKRSTS
jgi:hypothetical protein